MSHPHSRGFFHHLQQSTKLYGRTAALLTTIVVGLLLPRAQVFSFLIPYVLFCMLFLSFLGIRIDRGAVRISTPILLLANMAVALLAYFLLVRVDHTWALAAFMTGISPTAISAPVFVSFLKRRVEYVAVVSLLSNVLIALLLPPLLPRLVGEHMDISTVQVFRSVLLVVLLPLLLAHGARYLPSGTRQVLHQGKRLSFYLWLLTLFLVVSKSSHFVFGELSVPTSLLWKIALSSVALCVVNFSLGALIGGKELRREASQALGQKNVAFTIWVALTFVSPLVALGPTFYVACHNLYNALQLYRFERQHHRASRHRHVVTSQPPV